MIKFINQHFDTSKYSIDHYFIHNNEEMHYPPLPGQKFLLPLKSQFKNNVHEYIFNGETLSNGMVHYNLDCPYIVKLNYVSYDYIVVECTNIRWFDLYSTLHGLQGEEFLLKYSKESISFIADDSNFGYHWNQKTNRFTVVYYGSNTHLLLAVKNDHNLLEQSLQGALKHTIRNDKNSFTPNYLEVLYDTYKLFANKNVSNEDIYEYKMLTKMRECMGTDGLKPIATDAGMHHIECYNKQCNEIDKFHYSLVRAPHHKIASQNKCIHNGLRAVNNRQLKDIGDYDVEKSLDFMRFVENNINDIIPINSYYQYTFDEWTQHMDPHRKLLKYKARDQVFCEGPQPLSVGSVDSFTKLEIVIPAEDGVMKDPRLVSAKSNKYNVLGGPTIYSFSKALAECWSLPSKNIKNDIYRREGIFYYSSGCNKIDAGKWMEDIKCHLNNAIFYEGDFSTYDASMRNYLLVTEAQVYLMYNDDPDFANWLKTQRFKNGILAIKDVEDRKMINRIVYWYEGRRDTGDNNTSCGNTINDALLLLYALSRQCDVMNLLGKQIFIIVNSDDNVTALDPQLNIDEVKLVNDIKSLGLTLKLIKKNEYDVEFCSARWVPACVDGQETYILTNLFGRNLVKSYSSVRKHDDWSAWLKSNSFSYMMDYRHVDFMYAYHRYIYVKHANSKAYRLSDIETRELEYVKHLDKNVNIVPSKYFEHWFSQIYGGTNLSFLLKETSKEIINWKYFEEIFEVDLYGRHGGSVIQPTVTEFVKGSIKFLDRFNSNSIRYVEDKFVFIKNKYKIPDFLMFKKDSKTKAVWYTKENIDYGNIAYITNPKMEKWKEIIQIQNWFINLHHSQKNIVNGLKTHISDLTNLLGVKVGFCKLAGVLTNFKSLPYQMVGACLLYDPLLTTRGRAEINYHVVLKNNLDAYVDLRENDPTDTYGKMSTVRLCKGKVYFNSGSCYNAPVAPSDFILEYETENYYVFSYKGSVKSHDDIDKLLDDI
jgi:hypothetical protein